MKVCVECTINLKVSGVQELDSVHRVHIKLESVPRIQENLEIVARM